jgi:hypothetical protein
LVGDAELVGEVVADVGDVGGVVGGIVVGGVVLGGVVVGAWVAEWVVVGCVDRVPVDGGTVTTVVPEEAVLVAVPVSDAVAGDAAGLAD